MSDPNTNPVPLPVGSYDVNTLQAGLEKAAKGAAAKYDDAVRSAVADANEGVKDDLDARGIAGYEFRDVENEDLGVTESVQVFNPKLAAKLPDSDAISEADLTNRQAKTSADAVAKADAPTKE